ncbi:hypothetical protein GYMLUDRAFT_76404 [Collybiopsis luxurians FD-317 M1]|uniref:NAD(+) diphosphatase n=1 Tax=Collybiopsis luxurians FD-317 M1 TaxID=944289 RepID=A0A0D0CKK5_9AGAR|nr:hypothetical protein GYMLUDRAFT_76404 [Collybiopsis luxurians FD-317 M1]
MFSGSPLNRLSWLRTSSVFLNSIISSPDARWLLFKAGNPLTTKTGPKSTLAFLSTKDVRPFIGEAPYFGQGKDAGLLTKEEHIPVTEAVRHRGAPIVFLGLLESAAAASSTGGGTGALPSSEFADPEKALDKVEGTPYFAMDVADLELEDSVIDSKIKESEQAKAGTALDWLDARSLMASADLASGAIFAEGRSMVDWNSRNKFCAGCGSRNHSLWGGWKLGCSSLMPWADNTGRKLCPSGKGLNNYTHPRSDPVVIMIAVDQSGEKILMGQNNRFKGAFYSALAGFIEPGETFEDAVKREMWEEAGVKVWDVKYHCGQPWPFPASLMVGFYARADSTQPVRTDLDNELADARWFTREELLTVLNHATGSRIDLTKLDQAQTKKEGDPPFRVPPTTAVAGVLIRDWAEGKVNFPPFDLNSQSQSTMKGNL